MKKKEKKVEEYLEGYCEESKRDYVFPLCVITALEKIIAVIKERLYKEHSLWQILLVYAKAILEAEGKIEGKKKEKQDPFCPNVNVLGTMYSFRQVIKEVCRKKEGEGEEKNFDARKEVLHAFGFMAIAAGKKLSSEDFPKLKKDVFKIKNYKERIGGIPINIEDCSALFWCNRKLFDMIKEFFHIFIEKMLRNVEENTRIGQVHILEDMDNFIRIMVEECAWTINSDFTVIICMQAWDEVFQFAKLIGLIKPEESEWFYKDGEVDYDRFFTAAMVGLLAMNEARKGIVTGQLPVPSEEEKNIFIKMPDICQAKDEDWLKVLIDGAPVKIRFDKNGIRGAKY